MYIRFGILTLLLSISAAFASGIREFDLKTIERLGNDLTRVSQRSDRGATDPVRKRAVQTAKSALQGKLDDIHYDYVVLDDPDGSGFLVYALGRTNNPKDFVLAGHFRVTVSSDGSRAERVDALSRTLAIQREGQGMPAGADLVGMTMVQIVNSKPLETLIYTSNLARMPIYVATVPHGRMYEVANGKIKDTGKFAGKK